MKNKKNAVPACKLYFAFGLWGKHQKPEMIQEEEEENRIVNPNSSMFYETKYLHARSWKREVPRYYHLSAVALTKASRTHELHTTAYILLTCVRPFCTVYVALDVTAMNLFFLPAQ